MWVCGCRLYGAQPRSPFRKEGFTPLMLDTESPHLSAPDQDCFGWREPFPPTYTVFNKWPRKGQLGTALKGLTTSDLTVGLAEVSPELTSQLSFSCLILRLRHLFPSLNTKSTTDTPPPHQPLSQHLHLWEPNLDKLMQGPRKQTWGWYFWTWTICCLADSGHKMAVQLLKSAAVVHWDGCTARSNCLAWHHVSSAWDT